MPIQWALITALLLHCTPGWLCIQCCAIAGPEDCRICVESSCCTTQAPLTCCSPQDRAVHIPCAPADNSPDPCCQGDCTAVWLLSGRIYVAPPQLEPVVTDLLDALYDHGSYPQLANPAIAVEAPPLNAPPPLGAGERRAWLCSWTT